MAEQFKAGAGVGGIVGATDDDATTTDDDDGVGAIGDVEDTMIDCVSVVL